MPFGPSSDLLVEPCTAYFSVWEMPALLMWSCIPFHISAQGCTGCGLVAVCNGSKISFANLWFLACVRVFFFIVSKSIEACRPVSCALKSRWASLKIDAFCWLQVRDYSFSPDTGQIVAIKYDSLGQPVVPESIMTVWEVNVQYVQSVNPKFLVLQPGAQDRAVVISDGFIGQLYRGVQVRSHCQFYRMTG